MKKISIFILLLISNFAYSQSVKLEDLIAHFLQKNDSLQIIKSIVIDQDSIISIKNDEIKSLEKTIISYKNDSSQYNVIISNKDSIITNKDLEIGIINKENKKIKNKSTIKIIGLSVLEIGTLILLILSL